MGLDLVGVCGIVRSSCCCFRGFGFGVTSSPPCPCGIVGAADRFRFEFAPLDPILSVSSGGGLIKRVVGSTSWLGGGESKPPLFLVAVVVVDLVELNLLESIRACFRFEICFPCFCTRGFEFSIFMSLGENNQTTKFQFQHST